MRSEVHTADWNLKYYTTKAVCSDTHMAQVVDEAKRYRAVLNAMEAQHPQWPIYFAERHYNMPPVVRRVIKVKRNAAMA